MPWLRSNGVPLDTLARVGDLKYTFTWGSTGGGLQSIEWSMPLPVGYTHPALRKGALVELMAGPVTLGWASLTEPDRDEWTFTADGLYRMAEQIAAVDSAGAPSTSSATVITEAAARGWPLAGGGVGGSLSTASEGDSIGNYLSDVLNAYCAANGKRWWVDSERVVRVGDDPTTVSLALLPGTPGMPIADDDYASKLYGRYVSAVTDGEPSAWGFASSSDPVAAARWGREEFIVDLTPLGLITGTTASTQLAAMLAAGRARPAFARAVELVRGQVTTLGGTAPELWHVAAMVGSGVKVRHHGVLDSEGAPSFGGSLEWVAGSATHDVSARKLTLAPIGLAPRTLSQVLSVQAPRSEFA